MTSEPAVDAAGPSSSELRRSAIVRNLYDALMEARPYVFDKTYTAGGRPPDWRAETAAAILERVDAALADAGEVLS